jgi:hypothetical protein
VPSSNPGVIDTLAQAEQVGILLSDNTTTLKII